MKRQTFEYGEDFERLGNYFSKKKIDPDSLKSFRAFSKSMKKVGWDMSKDGQKLFYTYQRTYLQQTGAIPSKLPMNEVKVSYTGKVLLLLPKITKTGTVRKYWMSQERAENIGYRVSYKRKTREYKVIKGKGHGKR